MGPEPGAAIRITLPAVAMAERRTQTPQRDPAALDAQDQLLAQSVASPFSCRSASSA
jgi:hypothetical protein